MPLSYSVKDLSEVPEGLRAGFVEQEDGTYKLEAETASEVRALKKALESEKERRQKAMDRLNALPDGFDPERWQRLVQMEEEAERGRLTPKQREEVEAFRKRDRQEYESKLSAIEARAKQLESRLTEREIDAAAVSAIAKYKGSTDLLLPLVKQRVKMVQDGEDFRAQVLDEHGLERVGSGGAPMRVEELVAEMRQDDRFARAFDGSGSTGSGAQPVGQAGRGGATPIISGDDHGAFMANLANIAAGKVKVAPNG